MLQLPFELRQQCIQCHSDDIETLKALRLVNKELQKIAVEVLFRTATLNHTDESAQKFDTLAKSDLNRLVRRVIINTSSDPECDDLCQEEAHVLESFGEAIGTIRSFKNTEEVELRFARQCAVESDWTKEVAETTDFRIGTLESFFSALKDASKVKGLTIKNLQDHMDKGLFESDHFLAVRNRLSRLHLQIATESDDAAPENSLYLPACDQGFTHDLPGLWLIPLQNQLTHLTLYGAECLWGVWPFVDLRAISTFPRLVSLSLGNLTIAHDWQIDWILSHASTLEELLLDDCYIVTALQLNEEQAAANFPSLGKIFGDGGDSGDYFTEIKLRWRDVFARFEQRLSQLRRFAIGHGDWDYGRCFEERYELLNKLPRGRYMMFDYGIGPSQWLEMNGYGGTIDHYDFEFGRNRGHKEVHVEAPRCDEEDLQALSKLMKMVEERASAKP